MAASGSWIEFVLELALRAVFGALRGWDDWADWGLLLLIVAAILAVIWMLVRMLAKKRETGDSPGSQD